MKNKIINIIKKHKQNYPDLMAQGVFEDLEHDILNAFEEGTIDWTETDPKGIDWVDPKGIDCTDDECEGFLSMFIPEEVTVDVAAEHLREYVSERR